MLRTRDLVGRDVLDRKGKRVGSVRDLLLRRGDGVDYLEVDLGVFRKRVIVPARFVEWGEQAFVVRELTADQIGRLPAYETDRPITAAVLAELRTAYPACYDVAGRFRLEGAGDGAPRILPLRETKGYKVRGEEPDVRGWHVFASDDERVGRVADLLVDPAAMKVVYLDVDLHDDLYLLSDDRHVCVPLDHVDLRPRGHDVWVRGLTAREIARLPAYTGGAVDPIVIRGVARAFEGLEGAAAGRYTAPAEAVGGTNRNPVRITREADGGPGDADDRRPRSRPVTDAGGGDARR